MIRRIAIEQNQPAGVTRTEGAANPKMLTGCRLIAIRAPGKSITSHCTRIIGQTIPQPEGDTVGISQRHFRLDPTASEMIGTARRERPWFFTGPRKVDRYTGFQQCRVTTGRVIDPASIHFLQPPEGLRSSRHNCFGIVTRESGLLP